MINNAIQININNYSTEIYTYTLTINKFAVKQGTVIHNKLSHIEDKYKEDTYFIHSRFMLTYSCQLGHTVLQMADFASVLPVKSHSVD